ncbi:unnamed protein product [Leuciscus chuanchicus]
MVIHLLMLVCCDASGSLSRPLSINQARMVSVVTDVVCARERWIDAEVRTSSLQGAEKSRRAPSLPWSADHKKGVGDPTFKDSLTLNHEEWCTCLCDIVIKGSQLSASWDHSEKNFFIGSQDSRHSQRCLTKKKGSQTGAKNQVLEIKRAHPRGWRTLLQDLTPKIGFLDSNTHKGAYN